MDERTLDPWLTDGSLRRRWPLACISSMRASTACQRFLRRLVGVMSVKTDGGGHSASGYGNKLRMLLSDGGECVDQNLAKKNENIHGGAIFRSFSEKHDMMSMCAQLIKRKAL